MVTSCYLSLQLFGWIKRRPASIQLRSKDCHHLGFCIKSTGKLRTELFLQCLGLLHWINVSSLTQRSDLRAWFRNSFCFPTSIWLQCKQCIWNTSQNQAPFMVWVTFNLICEPISTVWFTKVLRLWLCSDCKALWAEWKYGRESF